MGNVGAERRRSAGKSEEGRKVGTLSRRDEDLASALMLRPHCRNQVSSISESGNTEVRESGGAEAWESGGAEVRKRGKAVIGLRNAYARILQF